MSNVLLRSPSYCFAVHHSSAKARDAPAAVRGALERVKYIVQQSGDFPLFSVIINLTCASFNMCTIRAGPGKLHIYKWNICCIPHQKEVYRGHVTGTRIADA